MIKIRTWGQAPNQGWILRLGYGVELGGVSRLGLSLEVGVESRGWVFGIWIVVGSQDFFKISGLGSSSR